MKRGDNVAVQKREEIRNYIRNERDPISIKWKALGESISSEDRRRSQFVRRRLREDTEVPPLVIRKFVGTLRKAVRTMMRNKGGTPYSIVRNLFLYWDADKCGALGVKDLDNVMKSIGCRLKQEDLQAIVTFYDSGHSKNEMAYDDLLHDISRGEPSITTFTTAEDDKEGVRFENVEDEWHEMPETVKKFLEAFRDYIAKRMTMVGGTPQEHIHPIFLKYDKEIKGGLTPGQLVVAARQHLKLRMTDTQAREIVKYYDRKLHGILEPSLFVQDVCSGVQSILHFSELSAEQIAAKKRAIAVNPFTVQPHTTKPNKVLEKFKVDTLKVLDAKVYNIGGSKRGWMREAFRFWDPRDLGVLSHYTHLQGAAKRLGLTLPDEDAHCLMKEYDVHKNGNLDYNILISDVVATDPHFLEDATKLDSSPGKHGGGTGGLENASVSSRAPKPAVRGIERFKMAADAYARKSGGRVEPRDVLYGTFLRFDPQHRGRADETALRAVATELGVRLKEHDLQTFLTWFDTNGSDCLDYNELVRQVYGDDVLTRPTRLPPIHSPVRDARNKLQAAQATLQRSGRSLGAGDGIGLDPKTLERNMQEIETQAAKQARKALRKQQIMEEKMAIQKKLEAVELQRNIIVEEYKQHQLAKYNAKKQRKMDELQEQMQRELQLQSY